jgi:multidrug efflux pump subunit AcrA (membrane-fusion protein)
MIPERLVVFSDDGTESFVERPGDAEDAEPVKVAVKLGLSDGLNVEIEDGLEGGDQVVQRPPREVGSIF